MNVLAEGQDDVSQNFARSGADKFAGVPWPPSAHGSPVLDDVVAWIDGELWAEYDGGDHTLAVARVLDLGADPSAVVRCSTTGARTASCRNGDGVRPALGG